VPIDGIDVDWDEPNPDLDEICLRYEYLIQNSCYPEHVSTPTELNQNSALRNKRDEAKLEKFREALVIFLTHGNDISHTL
jgi:hypothetical protein